MYITELTCPPLQQIQYGYPDTTDTEVDSVVTYVCLPGYFFPDGTTQRTSICLQSQKWSSTIDDCTRKKSILHKHIIQILPVLYNKDISGQVSCRTRA